VIFAVMQDTKTVVGKLELVIGVVLHIIFIFFYLVVFNVSSCTTPAHQLLPMP